MGNLSKANRIIQSLANPPSNNDKHVEKDSIQLSIKQLIILLNLISIIFHAMFGIRQLTLSVYLAKTGLFPKPISLETQFSKLEFISCYHKPHGFV